MKADNPRDLIAVGAIALAGVVGAVMLINDRLEDGLHQRRLQLEALSAESRFSPDAGRAHQLAIEAERLSNWLRGGPASTEDPLYARLLALGENTGVQIDRIDPGVEDAVDDGFAITTGFAIDAIGEYERIVRLIAAIESMNGFHVVTRFTLTPAEHADGDLVHASIQTTHFRFDPSALKARMALMDEEDE